MGSTDSIGRGHARSGEPNGMRRGKWAGLWFRVLDSTVGKRKDRSPIHRV